MQGEDNFRLKEMMDDYLVRQEWQKTFINTTKNEQTEDTDIPRIDKNGRNKRRIQIYIGKQLSRIFNKCRKLFQSITANTRLRTSFDN